MANAICINKANTAPEGSIEKLREAAARINPGAAVYVTDSSIVVDAPQLVRGKAVVLIEDGPTLTHGGMAYGAGKVRGAGAGGGARVCAGAGGGGGGDRAGVALRKGSPDLARNMA